MRLASAGGGGGGGFGAGIGLLWAWGGSSHKHLLLLILFMVFSVMGGWAIVYVCGCVCGAWHSQFQQKRQV